MAKPKSNCESDRRPKVLILNQLVIMKFFPTIFSKFRLVSAAEPEARSAEALLGNRATVVDAELFRRFPRLRIFVSLSTGFDRVDLDECRRRGVAVVNAGSTSAGDVADHTVALLMDAVRRVSAADRHVRAGLWATQGDFQPLGTKLRGKRVGIVGLGNIGSAVAKRLEAFGCEMAYNSRKRKPGFPLYRFFSSARELAANSDVVVLCCSLTEETRHVVDAKFLAALGKSGVVVNVGRGGLIDEKELVRRLVAGDIGGAALDVFDDEPNIPPELFGLDNVVLSPHIANFTPESFRSTAELAISNLDAFFNHKPLLTPV